jgi:hypothetical protein
MTFSNGNGFAPPDLSFDAIRKALDALKDAPPLPKVIYVRDDAWDQFTEAFVQHVSGSPSSDPLFGTGMNIRIEKVVALPRQWMTDLELQAMGILASKPYGVLLCNRCTERAAVPGNSVCAECASTTKETENGS